MTNDEFDRYAARTKQWSRSREIARAVLVRGKTIAQAGREAGVQHETARKAVARILREYRADGGYPTDWETRTVTLPRDDMDDVREIEDAALRRAGLRV